MNRTILAFLAVSYVSPVACGQIRSEKTLWTDPLPQNLETVRWILAETRVCLARADPTRQGVAQVDRLTFGLLAGWGYRMGPRQVPAPPPTEYRNSLERDLRACKAALATKDLPQNTDLLAAVNQDIQIKAQDCRTSGMGRVIKTAIQTVKNGQVVNGWEVLYKWINISGFDTQELRFPNLSSPAVIQLPPGQYLFRAQRLLNGISVSTEPMRMLVAGKVRIECQIQVP